MIKNLNIKLIRIGTILLLSVCLLSTFYANTQNLNGTIPLNATIQQQSTTFKNLIGQDRKAAFIPLQALIVTKTKSTPLPNALPCVALSKRADVYSLLGMPDEVFNSELVVYRLGTSTQNCKVKIAFDTYNNVIFTKIENCQ